MYATGVAELQYRRRQLSPESVGWTDLPPTNLVVRIVHTGGKTYPSPQNLGRPVISSAELSTTGVKIMWTGAGDGIVSAVYCTNV